MTSFSTNYYNHIVRPTTTFTNVQGAVWYDASANNTYVWKESNWVEDKGTFFILIINRSIRNTFEYKFFTRDGIDMCIRIQGLAASVRNLEYSGISPNILQIEQKVINTCPNWYRTLTHECISHNAQIHKI